MAATRTPIPSSQITMVFMLQMAECANVNVLFPFIAFMVEGMGFEGQRLGVHVGLLAGSFCFAQFTSSFMWGWVSDRYGRKPTIIFGTLGAAVGMLVFGLSRTYRQAMAGRILAGFLNGNLGVVKTFLTEVTDNTNRSYGFSLMSLAWSAGTVIAPVIGGLLCNPAEKYPKYFSKEGVFGVHPYFLPCLICVINSVICATLVFFVMTETLVKRSIGNATNSNSNSNSNGRSKNGPDIKYEPVSTIASSHGGSAYEEEEEEVERTQSTMHSKNRGSNDDRYAPGSGRGFDDEEEIGGIELTSKESKLIQKLSNMIEGDGDDDDQGTKGKGIDSNRASRAIRRDDGDIAYTGAEEDEEGGVDDENPFKYDDESDIHSKNSNNYIDDEDDDICCPSMMPSSKQSVLRQKLIVLASSNYALLAMAYVLLDETLPLFLKLDTKLGGLSFGSSDIGALLSIAGCVMVVFNYFLLPHLTKLGVRYIFRVGVYGSVPAALLWPLMAKLFWNSNHNLLSDLSPSTLFYLKWIAMIIVMIFKNILATLSFTAVMIQVNHSAAAEHLGQANGLGQSLASLARSIGPALGGVLWSFTIRYNFIYLNFLGFGFISLCCLFINAALPPSIELGKAQKNKSAISHMAIAGE